MYIGLVLVYILTFLTPSNTKLLETRSATASFQYKGKHMESQKKNEDGENQVQKKKEKYVNVNIETQTIKQSKRGPLEDGHTF